MQRCRIEIDNLKPGMVLAEDLFHWRTGTVLLSRGVVLRKPHMKAIKKIVNKDYCLVDVPPGMEATEAGVIYTEEGGEEEPEHSVKDSSSTLIGERPFSPFPEHVSHEDQERVTSVYKNTYQVIESTFQQAKNQNLSEVAPLQEAAKEITQEVVYNPELLMQIATLKSYDDYTFTHALHVAIYAATMAKINGKSKEEVYQIALAGLLHDIGKIDVPDEILNKPGLLSDKEWNIMKKHVDYGAERLSRINDLSRDIILAAVQHHEKLDGSGYPRGLRGNQIHPWARILTIVDIYDAVTTDRTYRRGFLPHTGAELLMSQVEEVDPHELNNFYFNIPFYPVGSVVELNTGEVGKVIRINNELPLRPLLQVFNEHGKEERLVDLTEELTTFIVRIMEPAGLV